MIKTNRVRSFFWYFSLPNRGEILPDHVIRMTGEMVFLQHVMVRIQEPIDPDEWYADPNKKWKFYSKIDWPKEGHHPDFIWTLETDNNK